MANIKDIILLLDDSDEETTRQPSPVISNPTATAKSDISKPKNVAWSLERSYEDFKREVKTEPGINEASDPVDVKGPQNQIDVAPQVIVNDSIPDATPVKRSIENEEQGTTLVKKPRKKTKKAVDNAPDATGTDLAEDKTEVKAEVKKPRRTATTTAAVSLAPFLIPRGATLTLVKGVGAMATDDYSTTFTVKNYILFPFPKAFNVQVATTAAEIIAANGDLNEYIDLKKPEGKICKIEEKNSNSIFYDIDKDLPASIDAEHNTFKPDGEIRKALVYFREKGNIPQSEDWFYIPAFKLIMWLFVFGIDGRSLNNFYYKLGTDGKRGKLIYLKLGYPCAFKQQPSSKLLWREVDLPQGFLEDVQTTEMLLFNHFFLKYNKEFTEYFMSILFTLGLNVDNLDYFDPQANDHLQLLELAGANMSVISASLKALATALGVKQFGN